MLGYFEWQLKKVNKAINARQVSMAHQCFCNSLFLNFTLINPLLVEGNCVLMMMINTKDWVKWDDTVKNLWIQAPRYKARSYRMGPEFGDGSIVELIKLNSCWKLLCTAIEKDGRVQDRQVAARHPILSDRGVMFISGRVSLRWGWHNESAGYGPGTVAVA